MKKIYQLGITMLLLLAATLPAAYAYNFQSGGIYYDITSPNTVAVTYATGSYNSYSGDVSIPSTVTYNGTTYTVTAIGNNAFRNCSGLTGVSIPGTVTSIGNYAFSTCSQLTSVTIPSTVKSVGEYAFSSCSHLVSVTISNGVESIGNCAFGWCSGVTSVTIPNSVKNIGYGAFSACSALTTFIFNADSCTSMRGNNYNSDGSVFDNNYSNNSSLTTLIIGNNVRIIPDYAFANLKGLSTINIPNSVTTIGNHAFTGCSNLSSITVGNNNPVYDSRNNCNSIVHTATNTILFGCKNTVIPNTVISIGNYAFYRISTLTNSSIIPISVKHIGAYAFSQCTGLTGTLTISDSILTIGNNAFNGCTGLNSVVIGRSVDSIGGNAFGDCQLTSVFFNADSCSYMGYPFGSYNYSVQTLTISNNVKTIPNYAFYGFRALSSLNIPNSVQRIGNYAFHGCNSLTGMLFIPDSVTYIGHYAFSGCSGLTGNLTLPNTATFIGDHAFDDCSGVTGTLTIPNSVTYIGYMSFSSCNISSVVFNADSCHSAGMPFVFCQNLKHLTIGNSVKILPYAIFSGCDSLMGNLIIPNSVTYIGDYAFNGCSGLTGNLILPNSLLYIGEYAFYSCSGFEGKLIIPDSVVTIGHRAFYNIAGLDTLVIGKAVESMGNIVFNGCSSLSHISFNADSCTQMYRQFSNCDSLATLTIGDNVKIIPNDAFYSCSGLTGKLFIPDSVKTIGERAFWGCNRLDSLIIGKAVSSIYYNSTFKGCSGLSYVEFNADSCTALGSDIDNYVFSDCNNINKIVIGNNVKAIPDYAFYNQSGLFGNLIIPDSVKYIGKYTFSNCANLSSLSLGRSIDLIGSCAFTNCTGLSSISSYNGNPPVIDNGNPPVYDLSNSFSNVNRNIPVYVPCGSAQDYRNAWRYGSSSFFYNIYETIQPYRFTVTSEDTLKGTVLVITQPSCTESPVIEATPNFFYVFDLWNDGNTDNPRTVELTQDTTLVAHFREYAFTIDCDTAHGYVVVLQTPTAENPQATVEAVVTDSCYVFAGWSNGTTENPLTITVTQDTLLTAIFNPIVNLQITSPSIICQGDVATFVATGADSYIWFNGDTTSVISLLPENSLEVSVTGMDSNGCSASATHSVNVLPRPELVISGMTDICEGESTILTATSSNPTEELLLFEDFENGIDGWYTMEFDGDGYNWYSTLGTVQSAYEGNGAAASASWWNSQTLTPTNMLYKYVQIPNTGAQLSWYAAAQDPNWPAEHYEIWIYTNTSSYPTSIFNETLTDDQWVYHTVDLNDWAGEYVLIGFVHTDCSGQYVLKIDNVRIVTFINDTYVWNNGHIGNQLSVNNAGTYYVTATKPNGCTSSDSVTVTVWQPDTVDITVNSPENYYVINDETFCTSGDYMQTLQNIHGCDSVINLHLTLAPRDTVFVTDTVCGGWHEIYWEDSSYDTTYIVYFDNAYDESVYSIAEYGGWGDAIVASDGLIYEFYVSGEYYRNDSLWIQYDETRTFEAVSGCDSVVKKHHYVKFSDWYGLRDTACGSYVWQGDTLMANPYYLYRSLVAEGLTNAQGCDSTVHLWLTLLPAIEETVSISACDSYTWNGVTYTESGVYTHNSDTTLQDVPACELSTLHLTINPSVTELVEATACDSYSWNDSTYTTSGEYLQTFTADNGCDSTVTLQLTINESKHTDTTAESCGSYTWNETTYTTSGEYFQTFTAANGCDSTVTLQLTILPLPTPNITGVTTVCEGQTATLNAMGGVSYLWEDGTTTNAYSATVSGLYTVTVTNAEGCSAMASTTVTVNPLPEVVITGNTTICPGGSTVLTATGADSYVWSNGSTNPSIPVNMFGQYSVIGTSAAGCFSTASVTVLVSLPPVITISGNTDICAGESTTLTANGGVNYMWSNGSTADTSVATTAGTWQVIGYNADGCSNMASVTVNLWQPATTNLYITSFDSCYMWFGTPRCESGDYTHTLQTIHGCDSVIILHLTLEDAITTEFSATSCDSYTWNGITYSQSGNYTQNFTAVNGNDSIVTLHLTINYSVSEVVEVTACDSYEWNGQTYTSSGNYTQTFIAANECDSVVTLNLTVNPSVSEVVEATACDSYLWNDSNYTVSGDYIQIFTAANGCDSVVTLHLTINHPVAEFVETTVCDSYEWNGQSYVTSGDYTQTFTAANGCDSVVTLHLIVNDTKHVEFADSTCTTYTWNGQSYAQSGDYTQNFTAANGCDSVVTLHLTIVPTITPVIAVNGSLTACGNGSATLTVPGNYSNFVWSTGAVSSALTVNEAGYYWVTATDVYGCEGVSEMVQLGGSVQIDETPAICMVGVDNDHNLVVWEPLTDPDVSEYRIYREDGQANIFEPLAVIPASNSNAYVDATADPSVRAYRYKITAADTCGGETPMSAFHKTVHLTINQGLGNSYNLIWTPYEGFEFSSYKLYRGTANNNLQLIQTMPSTLTSYTDNNPAGDALFYQIEVVMTESCVQQTRDITYTGARSNIVYNGVAVTTEVTIEACDSYDWNGQILTSSGDYTQNFVSELGYDSVVTLHLTINPSVTEVIEVTTPDSCYTWNGQNYCTSGTYTQTLQTVHGCDSVVTMHLTITVGVNDYDGFDFKVYPNPTTGVVNVQITNHNSPITEFHVFDAYGKLIRVVDVQTTQIDLSGFASGVYFIKAVSDGNVVAVRKVVKN